MSTPLSILCAILIQVVLVSLLVSLWRSLQQGIRQLRRMHQVPCDRCAFFTNDYHLKCTVHPYTALTEEAIGCMDYCPNRSGQRTI